jgi:hypothetical protein
MDGVVAESKRVREASAIRVDGARPGTYVQFESAPGAQLKLDSLESVESQINLVAVNTIKPGGGDEPAIELATVFIPEGKESHFTDRFTQYAEGEPTKKGNRPQEPLSAPIGSIRLARVVDLWTDAIEAFPQEGDSIWWEVWLYRSDGSELNRFAKFVELAGIEMADRRLEFTDRIVTLVYASPLQLAEGLTAMHDIAELRMAKEAASFFTSLDNREKVEWVGDLGARVIGPIPESPVVCILDTGVNQGHILLRGPLRIGDCHTYDVAWGVHDHHGHGTLMAGLALYGDLSVALEHSEPITLKHRLESVKIMPPGDRNPPELYGLITAEAGSRVEVTGPDRRRIFSMAVTARDQRDRGQPTSWSAAIDALAFGRSFDSTSQGLVYLDTDGPRQRRLFIISAGNIEDGYEVDHLSLSDLEAVHDPAQAWNALTVGAYTQKTQLLDPLYAGMQPLAAQGELSPSSTTSVMFNGIWPVKPDIVLEGGNVAHDGVGGYDSGSADLNLLSTHRSPYLKPYDVTGMTSAATAQAARMAAQITAEYPAFWPETVRGLMVHSARWTPRMEAAFSGASGKRARLNLIRRYGYGVPQLDRALRSASDDLTIVAQATLHPFSKSEMREMHFYTLPWPVETLEQLGEQQVTLRVSLSYFVEPNPARRGWRSRFRYASHGLRFEVKEPTESLEEFRKRLNLAAREKGEPSPQRSNGGPTGFLDREHGIWDQFIPMP